MNNEQRTSAMNNDKKISVLKRFYIFPSRSKIMTEQLGDWDPWRQGSNMSRVVVTSRLLLLRVGFTFLAVFLYIWTHTTMSSPSSQSEESSMSDDSEYNYIPCFYERRYENFEDEHVCRITQMQMLQ